jgi:hypothetical protein
MRPLQCIGWVLWFILPSWIFAQNTSPTNATVRLPTNIRVLMTNGTVVVVPMESYTAVSLAREWFSTWANYDGGSNSLKAGSVAVRSYAASYVNNPQTATYDICATTACQVYNGSPTANSTSAAEQTLGLVLLTDIGSISRTEYSAENNSLGFSCGDGFTQPSDGPCIFDPVCTGETRFGHGRGMCQWGSAKWATGLKIAKNGGTNYPDNANTGMTNGYPKQDWSWIVGHYYPNLRLVLAKPLVVGDDVHLVGAQARTNFMCVGGGISNGFNCTTTFIKAVGSTGLITAGPIVVTTDGRNHTWWKILWNDSAVGWLPENWLERVFPAPSDPTNLQAVVAGLNHIQLTWNNSPVIKIATVIERSIGSSNNWREIAEVAGEATTWTDAEAVPGVTYFYRARATNLAGTSGYSNTASASIPNTVFLAPIPNLTVVEGSMVTFTNQAIAPDHLIPVTDFETFSVGASALFRVPNASGSTSMHIASGSTCGVTSTFPANTNAGQRVCKASWTFNTGTTLPWLRLTTANASNLPNPVIHLTNKLRFDVYTDNTLKLAVGCRETTNATGTSIGSNGGQSGGIEFVAVKPGIQPEPVRTIPSNVWTTVIIDLPNEPAANFANGDATLSTVSGLGVLEHLAITPHSEPGAFNLYLDNFHVAQPKAIFYSLEPGAPEGASIHAQTGVFNWMPTEAQGPGNYIITVRATDDSIPVQSDLKTFNITVLETNAAPVLAAIGNRTVHAGNNVVITNAVTDPDVPANTIAFSLESSVPTGASIDSASGIFSWTPEDSFIGTSNSVVVHVTDDGSPVMSDARTFYISVVPRPVFSSANVVEGSLHFGWNTIPGRTYKLQFKNSLSEAFWNDLETLTAIAEFTTRNAVLAGGECYYRVVAAD